MFSRTALRKIGNSSLRAVASSRSLGVVPVINLQNLKFSNQQAKQAVADEINRACEDIGFITIVNHGIPKNVIDNAWNKTKEFFDLPVEVKDTVPMTKEYPYGYSRFLAEAVAAGHGAKEAIPDLKESFTVGPYNPAAGMPPVQYPAQPAGMKEAVHAYYQQLENLSVEMMRLFALGLKLPENWFEDKIDKHRSALRALNYPELTKKPEPGQERAGAHTDYGSLTILLQDQVGGLQVRPKSGGWQDVPYIEGAFVINIGDMMNIWTNERWVSTLHRVVPSQTRRQSMAFFHNINADVTVSCIPTCTGPDNPPKHQPVNSWEFLMNKHLKSQY